MTPPPQPPRALRPRRAALRCALGGLTLLGLLACGRAAPAPGRSAEGGEAGPPARIVSATLLSDEILWDLGPSTRARVVAVSAMVDDPQYSPVAGRWPAALPRVPGVAEALVALDPDLVVLASFTAPETRAALAAAHIELVVLEEFRGFEDYRRHVRSIARATGDADAADTLLAAFDARRAAVAAKAGPGPGPRILSWNDGSVPGAETSFDDAARLAGLTNVAAEAGRRGHGRVGAELLVAWDPDWIVVPCAAPGDTAGCDAARTAAARDPALRATRAQAGGQLVAIPGRQLYDVGAGMLDLAARLQAEIRPPGGPPGAQGDDD